MGCYHPDPVPPTVPMILSLCLLLPGSLRGPTLYLSQMSARPGASVQLQCSVFSRAPATRIIFCKDGEEVSSQRGLEKKATYGYNHAVSRDSSGNYSCGYEIKDSDNQVTRSLLSPSQHLSVTGNESSMTPATLMKIILNMPPWIGWEAPGIHGPRQKRRRHTRPSLCSGTDVINDPLPEMQDSSVRSRITEPPKTRGNCWGHAARKWETFSGATAGQCTAPKVL
ncbi:B12-dependent methionine synthase [Platysternon megacephalum]|uniref:B12-dependent methionine synthase n=1 Tax=Platysternon megacephalum TaxID=55544 RepID=A0A4D9DMB4_9SAUR|nr:B12-dependent methionine synthase [Platysternon megacephalum]